MQFALDADQQAFRQTARRFLARHAPMEAVRATMATEAGWDAALWRRLAAELGCVGLAVPEADGGAGLDAVWLGVMTEELGRALTCAPFLSTACLALPLLVELGTDAQRAEHVADLLEGERTATLALPEAGTGWDPAAIATVARRSAGGYVLDGVKRLVPDGHTADLLLVVARAEGTRGADGLAVLLVPGDAPGVARRALPTVDQTRRLAEIRLEGVRVAEGARLGADGTAAPALARALERARVALAAEQVGGAERCLEMAVEYAGDRVQFGRPIGSFQAVKHRCADMLVRVESARSAAWYAAWAETHAPERRTAAADVASLTCGEAFFRCAADSIQVHGGIGFTWEHDAHLYLKRARADLTLFGDATACRSRVARALGLRAAPPA